MKKLLFISLLLLSLSGYSQHHAMSVLSEKQTTISFTSSEIENGTFSSSTGLELSSTTKIRCIDYVNVESYKTIRGKINEDYILKYNFYDSTETVIFIKSLYINEYNEQLTSFKINIPDEAKYFRFAVGKIGAPTIYPSEISSTNLSLTLTDNSLYEYYGAISRTGIQSFDIYNNTAFIFRDSGYTYVYDVSAKSIIDSFYLASAHDDLHCGTANFGVEFPSGNTDFPAIYVSGELTTKTCYVESITESGSIIIQSIVFNLTNGYSGSQVLIDRENECIWYGQREYSSIALTTGNTIKMMKFPLPLLSEGTETTDSYGTYNVVTYTDSDIIEQFDLPVWMPYYQGATIKNNILYQPGGNTGSTYSKYISVRLFNLDTYDEIQYYDFEQVNTEPQCVSFSGRNLMVLFVDKIYKF